MTKAVQLIVFLLVVLAANAAKSATPAELPEVIGPTVHRYLASGGNYMKGDLIAKSQLEELQMYLRRTRGHSLATHAKWRKRMLPDNALLVQMFQSEGRKVLRKLAAELGSYADLDRLSHTAKGRELLTAAIKQESIKEVITHLEREKAARETVAEKKMSARQIDARIYTADEFLAEVAAAMQAKMEASVGSGLPANATPNR